MWSTRLYYYHQVSNRRPDSWNSFYILHSTSFQKFLLDVLLLERVFHLNNGLVTPTLLPHAPSYFFQVIAARSSLFLSCCRIFWALVLLVMLALFIRVLTDGTLQYLRYPSGTRLSLLSQTSLPPFVVTVCNNNKVTSSGRYRITGCN